MSEQGETEGAEPVIVVIAGVSGSGKTTVGAMLAGSLGWEYAEADAFHPEENIARMEAGEPLTDEDRWPWLESIGAWMDRHREAGTSAVVTCSALKRSYRNLLRQGRPQTRLVYLRGDRALIEERLAARHGHFFPTKLLDSQFADLEEPGEDEDPVVVSVCGTPAEIVADVRQALARHGCPGVA